VEFPVFLANHLPMVLVALRRMGASDDRLEAYCDVYCEANGLVPVPAPIGEVTRENWRDFLGQREREGDYRAFFAGEVARLGGTQAAIVYLPQLFGGFAASALHAFMRMAYATFTDSDEETGVALAYWAATYLPLGDPQGRPASTDDPAEVLAYMYGPATFRHVETERDLLWHFMRAVAQMPEFAPVVDMLAIGPETHDRIARLALALYASTGEALGLRTARATRTSRAPDLSPTPSRVVGPRVAKGRASLDSKASSLCSSRRRKIALSRSPNAAAWIR
jgi:hypothetical protein